MRASRLVLVSITTVILMTSPAGTVRAAANGSPGCVTPGEFRHAHGGMTLAKVRHIFGTAGTSLFVNPGTQHNSARQYPMCAAWQKASGDTTVQVQYNNYATNGGPQRLVLKQHY